MDETLLGGYGHVGCMLDDRLVRKIACSIVEGLKRWIDAIKEIFRVRGFLMMSKEWSLVMSSRVAFFVKVEYEWKC